MSSALFTLSAFGDEIADDLEEQLRLLGELRIGFLELRGAWGKNVLQLSDDEVEAVRRLCVEHGIAVSCIGSPIGKSPLGDPLEPEQANLERLSRVAEALGTRRVRIFSFYPPDSPSGPEAYLEEAAARLRQLAALAQRADVLLLLENERGLVGDTPERCATLLAAVDSPNLRFVWDTANFVRLTGGRPVDRGWPLLSAYLAHVQIKDARLADGTIQPAGEGNAQVGELLVHLREAGYRGFLALEPHLAFAGPRGGFSGVDGMTRAAGALRRLMATHGCVESSTMPRPG